MNLSLLSAFPGIFFWAYGLVGLIFITFSFLVRRRIPLKGIALTNLRTETAYWTCLKTLWKIFRTSIPEIRLARTNNCPQFGLSTVPGATNSIPSADLNR